GLFQGGPFRRREPDRFVIEARQAALPDAAPEGAGLAPLALRLERQAREVRLVHSKLDLIQ
ncbi:MAG: hypothetical protein J7M29_04515, partial [Verrucomicrobia bacterium]|nr:hypothetical protein [Verrucomicrobiota bacterium]